MTDTFAAVSRNADRSVRACRSCLFVSKSMDMGGSERTFVAILSSLRDIRPGVRFTVALFHGSGLLLPELPPDVEVVDLGGRGPRSHFLCGVRLCFYLWRHRPNAMVAFHSGINAQVSLWSIFAPATALFIVEDVSLQGNHRTGEVRRIPVLRRLAKTILYRRAQCIVAKSRGLKDELQELLKLPSHRLAVVNDPVDLERMSFFRREPDQNAFTFVYLGRFAPQKNVVLLLEAFADLCRVEPRERFSLKLIGYGEKENALRRLSEDLLIAGRVVWKGLLPEPWGEVAAGHALVLPSNYEGFGNVIVEALALGRPVIATDCPHGPAEIVSGAEDLGILVPVGDRTALARAMRTIWKDYPRWAAGADRRIAYAERFSKKVIVQSYSRLLFPDKPAVVG